MAEKKPKDNHLNVPSFIVEIFLMKVLKVDIELGVKNVNPTRPVSARTKGISVSTSPTPVTPQPNKSFMR